MKFVTLYLLLLFNVVTQTVSALPPPEDIPEEVLRTEIILEGRSLITGKPLTATEYAQEQVKIAQSQFSSTVDPQIRELIFLLRLRKLFKTLTPF